MLSKNKSKFIRSLTLKKFRDAHQCFIAEGPKVVEDLRGHFKCKLLVGTEEYIHQHPTDNVEEVICTTHEQLEHISSLKSVRDVIAVFEIPQNNKPTLPSAQQLVLALDDIQDPGNLGTILRLCDWMGIHDVYCSKETVDVYSSKVIQATMGALARVKTHYVDLVSFLQNLPKDIPVYGTFLDGEDIYNQELTEGGVLIMGNEGKGISKEIAKLINRRLYIPNYPIGTPTSESLNVAIATAIVTAEFRRQQR